ncbi:type II secretion system protein [Candidatus Riflebacteria bacterium]
MKKILRRTFTLVEMVIVLGIILTISTMALGYYKEYSGEAKIAQLKTNLRQMRLAIDRYQAKYLLSPKKLNDLIGLGLPKIPLDPIANSSQYELRVATSTGQWKTDENDSLISAYGFDNIRSTDSSVKDL